MSSPVFRGWTTTTPNLALGVCGALTLLYLLSSLLTAFRTGLKELPGPILARFSGLYRLSLVLAGQAPYEYRKLHEQYGPIVRTGPNHVSIADPAVVPQVYGIGSHYMKVRQGRYWGEDESKRS